MPVWPCCQSTPVLFSNSARSFLSLHSPFLTILLNLIQMVRLSDMGLNSILTLSRAAAVIKAAVTMAAVPATEEATVVVVVGGEDTRTECRISAVLYEQWIGAPLAWKSSKKTFTLRIKIARFFVFRLMLASTLPDRSMEGRRYPVGRKGGRRQVLSDGSLLEWPQSR